MEPRNNTKSNNESRDICPSYQSPARSSPSSSYYIKKNISKSANAFRDKSINNTVNNNVKIEEEAPITTFSI